MGRSSEIALPVPRFMDLCSGLGIDSVVFVDLDAVMLELLFEPRCKWLESEAGGQPLLVFAALERLWADLQTCQDLSCGRLQVLDFTEQGSAWRQPSLKLLRLSIFGFLSAYGVPMHKVSSWSCPDFQQLLQRCNTAFVLTSDASQSNPEWAAKHKDVEIVACCLAAQAAYGSASGLWNSAFISHLGVMEGRAFGFRTMSLRPSKAAKARALNFASAALKDVQQSQQSISSSLPGSGPGQGIGNTTSNPGCFEAAAADPARPGDFRTTVTGRACLGAAACCKLVHSHQLEGSLEFALAWTIQEGLLDHLPVQNRALQSSNVGVFSELFLSQLEAFYHQLEKQLAEALHGEGTPGKQQWLELCDLYDTRLLLLAWQLCRPKDEAQLGVSMALSGFPVRVAIRALELWRAILQQSQLTQAEVEQADSFTGQLQVSIAAASTSADAAEQVHELHQVQLLEAQLPENNDRGEMLSLEPCVLPEVVVDNQQPAGNALIERLRQAALDAAAAADVAAVTLNDSQGQSSMIVLQRRFLEEYHWHSGKPLEPAIWSQTQETAIMLSKYQTPSQLLACSFLRKYYKRKITEALRQCRDRQLVSNRADADKHLAEVTSNAVSALKDYKPRMEALNSRALQIYATSLSNTTFINRSGSVAAASAASKPVKQKKTAAVVSRGAEQIREQNKLRQASKNQEKLQAQWLNLKQTLPKQGGLPASGEAAIAKLLKESASAGADSLTVEVSLFKAAAHLDVWREEAAACRKSAKSQGPSSTDTEPASATCHAVQVWHIISRIWNGRMPGEPGILLKCSSDDVKSAAGMLTALGFSAAATMLKRVQSQCTASRGSSSQASSNGGGSNIFRFQMQLCGHLLPRDPGTKDHRTSSFDPDPWQQQVLDIIDQGASALVCAPTSSGKTFISNYVMCKVLAESSSGVVVFVAPTKALVNQVQAQVYADFKEVAGTFTRDFRSHVLDSRILVTVPACLEILLLSPNERNREWASRIQYVIFDEIHCLREGGLTDGGSQDSSGAIWEHLLTFIQCPFLALSATVGNPDHVHGWLASLKELQEAQDTARALDPASSSAVSPALRGKVQRKKGDSKARRPPAYNVSLITSSVRHADLRLHVFQPRPEPKFDSISCLQPEKQGECPWKADSRLLQFHPLAPVQLGHLCQEGGFPFELPFEPRDSLQLYDCLQSQLQAMSADNKASPEWLSAASEQLKVLSPETFFADAPNQSISRTASRRYEAALKQLMCDWAKHGGKKHGGAAVIKKVLQQLRPEEHQESLHGHSPLMDDCHPLMNLLVLLSKRDMLPAIIFNFNRSECDCMGEALLELLEHLEGNDDDDEMSEQFSFVRPLECHLLEEAQEQIEKLTEFGDFDESDSLIQALRRGIGVHHAGLNTKYRKAVEILFRARYLRVVIATGTLAYGINMPCRTVVFAGDSVFFDPLQYRQMMGRAGRRGFDTLGHVIFFGVPKSKRESLMLSPVPRLSGNFPMSISLFMRTMVYQAQAPEDIGARDGLLRMMQRPMYAHGTPGAVAKMMHLSFYAQMHCKQQGLLDSANKPVGLTGLVTHLFWAEPENLAFSSLLQSGVFHDICNSSKSWDVIALRLLTVLSHLFEREPLHWTLQNSEIWWNSPSKVVLEEMAPCAQEALARHNAHALSSIVAYAAAALGHSQDSSTYQMPFSGLDFTPRQQEEWVEAFESCAPKGSMLSCLQDCQVQSSICSPFAALSGLGDAFQSPGELVRCMKPGLLLNASAVPQVRQITRQGVPVALNRYVLDYWQHGQKQALVNYNHFREGDAYNRLLGFRNVLRALAVAMENMSPETDCATLAFKRLAEEFGGKFALFNGPRTQRY